MIKTIYIYTMPIKQSFNKYKKGKYPCHWFYGLNELNDKRGFMANFVGRDTEKDELSWSIDILAKLFDYDTVISTQDAKGTSPFGVIKYNMRLQRPQYIIINTALLKHPRKLCKDKIKMANLLAADKIISYSKSQIPLLKDYFNIPSKKLVFFPFGVDINFFRPSKKIKPKDFILSTGYCGRDYATLIEVLKHTGIKAKIFCLPFNINKLKIPQNVQILLNISYMKIRDLYARAKFVVLPLHKVDYSVGQVALLEAMASGKAVIVSKVPPIVDYVKDRQTALFVKPYNKKDLVEKINYLNNHPDEIKRLGRNARRVVERNFNNQIYARNLAKLLRYINKDE